MSTINREINEDTKKGILELYERTKSFTTVGNTFGIERHKIKILLIKMGAELPKTIREKEKKEIISLYQQGFSAKEIAKKYNKTLTWIYVLFKRMGIGRRDTSIEFSESEKKDIIDKYIGGLSCFVISKIYEVSDSTIKRLLQKNGIHVKKRTIIKKELCNNEKEKIINMYSSGYTMEQCRKEMKINKETIRKTIMDGGIKIKKQKLTKEKIDSIIKEYKEGKSYQDISIWNEVSLSTISSVLKRYGAVEEMRIKKEKTNKEEKEKIASLYVKCVNINKISKETGRSRDYIVDALHKNDLPVLDAFRGTYVNEYFKEDIKNKYVNDKKSVKTICSELNIPRTTVNKVLKEGGVKIREVGSDFVHFIEKRDKGRLCANCGEKSTGEGFFYGVFGKSTFFCKKCGEDRIRRTTIKSRYKITEEEYEKKLEKQEGVCEICGGVNKEGKNGKRRRLSIDHDHKTGKIRGLLCNNCNFGIGFFCDNIKNMERAIEYLKKYNQNN